MKKQFVGLAVLAALAVGADAQNKEIGRASCRERV